LEKMDRKLFPEFDNSTKNGIPATVILNQGM